MNRNMGAEATMGLGGGMVSEESRRNLEIAEGLCRKRKPNQAAPYLLKSLKQDPNNLDAIIQMAFLSSFGITGALEILEMAELQGRTMLKDKLGDDCFEDDGDAVGKFWMILPTRPYMRVLQALVKVYFDAGKYDDSTKTIIEMMRLCPGDNMGQRFWVGTLLTYCERYADALHFCQEWMTSMANEGIPPPRGGTAFKTPHRNTMAKKKEKNFEYMEGAILYSAALASFKHFGDCEQSQQYLRLAAKVNPNVLLKILANVKRPTNLNNDPRSMNGPEDAQDYLWLAQDLWMKPEIWNWANDNPDVKSAVLKVCSRPTCGVREIRVAEYKRCSACHLVSYCSGACQKDDWVRHKPECLNHKRQKAAMRAFSKGKAPPRDSPMPMFASDMMGAMPPL